MRDNQMKPRKTKVLVRLLAMMVILGFAAQGMAQPLPEPRNGKKLRGEEWKGYVLEKSVNEEGTELTMKSYVTGDVTITNNAVPVDITLVLDVSGSMADNMSTSPRWVSENDGFSYSRLSYRNYFYKGPETNDEYKPVGRVSNSYYCYMWFDYGSKRYYLNGTQVIEAQNQIDPTWNGNSGTRPQRVGGGYIDATEGRYRDIWTGTLWYRGAPGQISKIEALKDAVSTFIDMVDQQAQDNAIDGQPIDHRISIVKYARDSYYNSASSLAEGNHLDESNYNYTEVVRNFYNVTAHSAALKTAVNNLRSGGATAADYGMNKATYLFSLNAGYSNPSHLADDPHKKVVVLFTDGEPNHSNGFDNAVANSTIAYAKKLKDAGALVYTVGVLDNLTNKMRTYMNYVSSNYPQATSMTNGAGHHSDKYFFNASSTESLSDMFETIASEVIQVTLEMDEQTVVQDVISDYFTLPEGTIASHIKVFTANCIRDTLATHGYTFGPETPFDANIELTEYEGRSAIRVSNFNFTENYVAVLSEGARGKQLIIKIPIEPLYNEYGVLPTNADGSTIYPNGGDEPLDEFPVPHYYVKQTTWVEHTNTQPVGWSLDSIDSNEDLAWLISYVSGYNGQEAHPDAVATLTADVDMGQYCWVPIGGSGVCLNKNASGNWVTSGPAGHGFTGSFNGQGFVIDNLNNHDVYTMPQAGMFGYVNGATIQNVFVTNADFQPAVGKVDNQLSTGTEGHFGIIADTLCNGAVLKNSEAHGLIMTYPTAGRMLSENTGYTSPLQDPTKCYIGGLVGLVGRDKNGAESAAIVHSSISVASLAGYSIGGAVNEVNLGSKLYNSYSYPTLHSYDPTVPADLGGLAAVNGGKVENCYLRERATDAAGSRYGIKAAIERINTAISKGAIRADWRKGLLVGNNQGSVLFCYVPNDWSTAALVDANKTTTSFVGYGSDAPASLASFAATSTPYMYKHHDTQVASIAASGSNVHIAAAPNDRLLQALNAWTNTTEGTGTTKWFRTTADAINNDYPVLKIAGLQTVASDDQVVLYYGDVNEALSATGRSMKSAVKTDDVICLYENAAVTEGNNGTTLYINEDVAITQTQALNAFVGITLDNSAGAAGANSGHPSYEFPNDAIDWHMFATSLSNAPLGVNYTDVGTHAFTNYDSEDTPQYSFFSENTHNGYFPSKNYLTNGDYYADWDFYCWNEPYCHYVNFKRNKNDHYVENVDSNGNHTSLIYDDNDQPANVSGNASLIPGKGYLVALATETFLQSYGTLNNGTVTRSITSTQNPFCVGYNLIGNPYQSYLDFDLFAAANGFKTYAVLDEDQMGYETYTSGASSGMRYINMHQGFFVQTPYSKDVVFDNNMRNISATTATFRGEEQAAYPYVKLTLTEADGYRDYTTIEFDRPELGGGEKMKDLRLGDAQIFVHYGDVSYSTFFATSEVTSVPVRFNTYADGTFCLNWEVVNARFGNLSLVDNLTGQAVDMLSRNSYKFEGRASDYASRFKVVFALTETEEEENETLSSDTDFAFQMEGNLVVNGQGRLEMFDVSGRLVVATELHDVQSTIGLSEMAQGVYVMRLANDKSVKVQKIVIR